MPQPIEVHVGAAVDGHQPFVLPAFASDEFLDTRNGQRPCGLDYRASILEHILDRGADLVRIQQQDLVDMRLTEIVGLLANTLDRNAVGEYADAIETHAFPRLERLIHTRGVFRLHTDDPDVRIKVFHVNGDTADEAAAADRNEDRIDVAGGLPQHLHTD